MVRLWPGTRRDGALSKFQRCGGGWPVARRGGALARCQKWWSSGQMLKVVGPWLGGRKCGVLARGQKRWGHLKSRLLDKAVFG